MNVPYFMEDRREAGRLVAKVDSRDWVARYVLPHLSGSEQVLEIGCGPGHLASAVARCGRKVSVTGVDLNSERFSSREGKSIPKNLHLVEGNAYSLPFDDESFDLIYCRFLLEYLAQPQVAIDEMLRVAKPGALILLQDLDGQLVQHWPADPEMERELRRVIDHLAKTGFDVFIGRKLFPFAQRAGLGDIHVSAESYHWITGRVTDTERKLWQLKLDIALEAATVALGSKASAVALKERFLNYLDREDSMTFSQVFTVTGRKPVR